MAFDERMRSLRISRGLSQKELAEKTGVSRVSIGFYERGERVPPADIAGKIAKELNVSVDYLLVGEAFNEETNTDQDKRFQRAYETLEYAGFTVCQDEKDAAHREWRVGFNEFNIATVEDENRLMDIVDGILRDAEARKELYIKKRLIAEFDGSTFGSKEADE